jgi:hypothetical protein
VRHAGPLIGAVLVLVLLFISPALGLLALAVVVIAAVVFFATDRSDSRPCPRCGEQVKNGVLDCPHCSFDFRTIGAPEPPREQRGP